MEATTMKIAIEKFLSQFPDNATCWSQATDEVRDMAREARQIYNDLDLNVTEDECLDLGKGLQPLDFRSFNKPSEWNTQSKKFILDTFDKMSGQAKASFFGSFSHWLTK